GVSHLVQSTRAGADYGMGLLWALILVNLFKYPFFEFGARYTGATGESLLDGYKRLGQTYIRLYFLLSLATMFTIQTAVTIVTAGIANALFGDVNFLGLLDLGLSGTEVWTIIILSICLITLLIGKYKALDKLIKIIIVLLAVSTLVAVISATNQFDDNWNFLPYWPENNTDLVFLIAFMGWMPAPIDVSVFHSLWAEKKGKSETAFNVKEALFDFNIGYIATIIIGVLFLCLGYLVMFGSGASFGSSAVEFAYQLIGLYTNALGGWSSVIISIAALTAMFSTTITTLDASPRAMARSAFLIFDKGNKLNYLFWLLLLTLGTLMIFIFLASEMALLIKIATILSFITAPFYAALNFWLVCSTHTPEVSRPKKSMRLLSWGGLIFLLAFSTFYLISLI
ncbi:MAG: divalent metal cation transporter, partial [Bacteroidota bacterium]